MAWRQTGDRPLPEAVTIYSQLGLEQILVRLRFEIRTFIEENICEIA